MSLIIYCSRLVSTLGHHEKKVFCGKSFLEVLFLESWYVKRNEMQNVLLVLYIH